MDTAHRALTYTQHTDMTYKHPWHALKGKMNR